MAAPVTSAAVFAHHLQALGIRPGMALAVHARLLSFGRLEGGAETACRALRAAVGPAGTLVFPTYTLDLDPAVPFDPAATPSTGMGTLAEYARRLPDAVRTKSPLHSHAVLGPGAEVLSAADPWRSFGPGSAFEAMKRAGFHLLLLGCSVHEGGTFVHHVEASAGVPYREWITLHRRVVGEDGAPRSVDYSYYGRRSDRRVTNNLARADAAIRALPEARVVPVGTRSSLLVPLGAVDRAVRGLLAQHPYALVDPPAPRERAHAG